MTSSRRIEEKDRLSIEQALARDAFHKGTTADTFYKEGVITNVYEDSEGAVFLLRASRSLRIDMMFFSNDNKLRNAKAMIEGFRKLADNAKASGFQEITTSTNSPEMLKFVCEKFGFEEVNVNGEIALRRLL